MLAEDGHGLSYEGLHPRPKRAATAWSIQSRRSLQRELARTNCKLHTHRGLFNDTVDGCEEGLGLRVAMRHLRQSSAVLVHVAAVEEGLTQWCPAVHLTCPGPVRSHAPPIPALPGNLRTSLPGLGCCQATTSLVVARDPIIMHCQLESSGMQSATSGNANLQPDLETVFNPQGSLSSSEVATPLSSIEGYRANHNRCHHQRIAVVCMQTTPEPVGQPGVSINQYMHPNKRWRRQG